MKIYTPALFAAGLWLAGCGPSDAPAEQNAATSNTATRQAVEHAPAPSVAPSIDIGKMVFRRCISCHTLEAGGANGIGPNLHNIVGRPVASAPGFAYSNAMRAKGGIWDEAKLDHYLEQPMKALPGTRMAFAGIIDPVDRQSLFLYLQTNGQ